MKIVVLVKEVPDTYGKRRLNLETGLADRGASEAVVDEIGERALEAALTAAEGIEGASVLVLSVSPEGAASSIRKGLAMGAESAVQVVDEGLTGADLGLTAQVLAAALGREQCDAVIAGNASTDGSGGVIPAMIAELLDVPHLTNLSEVQFTDSTVSGTRVVEDGVQKVSAELPAVVSVTEALPEARFPNFKGIMAAKKKPFEVLSLTDLGIDADDMTVPRSIMLSVAEEPPREAGVKITDEGDAGQKLADYLIENRLA